MAVEDIASRPAEIDLPERYLDRRRLASSELPHFAERPCSWAHKQVDTRPSGRATQTNQSKTKSNQINPSKIAWFHLVLFVRNRTFQWVTTNPNKNLSHCNTVS
jgi:hypothetical protein